MLVTSIFSFSHNVYKRFFLPRDNRSHHYVVKCSKENLVHSSVLEKNRVHSSVQDFSLEHFNVHFL